MAFFQWPRRCTPKARDIVLNVINSAKAPLATKEIYSLSLKSPRPTTPPPHKTEEIRSIRYLKKVVLRDLAAQNHIEKVRVQGAFTAWLWRPKHAQAPAKTPVKPEPATSSVVGSTELTPAAVGVGEDWSHLNKRRQRARKMKVERDLQRMLQVQKTQKKAAMQPEQR